MLSYVGALVFVCAFSVFSRFRARVISHGACLSLPDSLPRADTLGVPPLSGAPGMSSFLFNVRSGYSWMKLSLLVGTGASEGHSGGECGRGRDSEVPLGS